MFEWLYWHVLLPGRDIPGITSHANRRASTAAPDSTLTGPTRKAHD